MLGDREVVELPAVGLKIGACTSGRPLSWFSRGNSGLLDSVLRRDCALAHRGGSGRVDSTLGLGATDCGTKGELFLMLGVERDGRGREPLGLAMRFDRRSVR